MKLILFTGMIIAALAFAAPSPSNAEGEQQYDKCEFVLVGGNITLLKPADRWGASEVGFEVFLDYRSSSGRQLGQHLMHGPFSRYAKITKEEIGVEVELFESLNRVALNLPGGPWRISLKRSADASPASRQRVRVTLNDENWFLDNMGYGGVIGRGSVMRKALDVDFFAKASSFWVRDSSLGLEVGEFNFLNDNVKLKLRLSRSCEG